MKTRLSLRTLTLPALLFITLIAELSTSHAQSPEFTYQGRLTTNGVPVAGAYDFEFRLFDDPAAGTQINSANNLDDINVSDGVFTVTLDYGDSDFDGSPRFLEIAVRPGTSTNGYTMLSPRQPITATPYAIQAASAGSAEFLSGTISTNNIGAGTIAGFMLANGAVGSDQLAVGAVNSITIADGSIGENDLSAALASNTFWRLDGNSGTSAGTHFIGTTDNQPAELKVNNLRALRLEDNGDGSDSGTTPDGAPNVIGGSPANSVGAGVVGATIGGGGATNFSGTIRSNRVEADYSTIAGGMENTVQANSRFVTIGGGGGNTVQTNAHESTISGGGGNTVRLNADSATIGGGRLNTVQVNADFATIAGGIQNQIGTNSSFSVIGGGDSTSIGADTGHAVIGGGYQSSIGTNSDWSVIGGGFANAVGPSATAVTIAGGFLNNIRTNADNAAIGGGQQNVIGPNAAAGTIAGGFGNLIDTNAFYSAIGGGSGNRIGVNSVNGAIAGGSGNVISTNVDNSIIGGGSGNRIAENTVIGTIAGGVGNELGTNASYSTIGGGEDNNIGANAHHAVIPGGWLNAVGQGASHAFAAGRNAKANHTGDFVWADSQLTDFASTGTNQFLIRASGGVGIGETAPEAPLHISEGSAGTVTASANSIAVLEKSGPSYLTMLTPAANESGVIFANPNSSVEAGIFHLSSTGMNFRTGTNSTKMVIQPSGNVGIGITNPTNKLHVAGGVSATAFVNTSDRNAKENFTAVSPAEILAKVASLPITRWNFKEMKDGPHLGPMAQDFYTAFGLGGGDTTITTVDAYGVALAAIQGLNQKLEETRAENAELRRTVNELKELVQAMNHNQNRGAK